MKVLILIDAYGSIDQVVTDNEADVICVCEHAPNDRLYRLTETHEVNADRVSAILGDEVIGSASDDRHAAIANRITSGQSQRVARKT